MKKTKCNGYSLIEIMLVIVIVILLCAIVYAAFAPVRAKASEVQCMNNLRQIGAAIQMYRSDYGGDDPPTATTISQLGLPPYPRGPLALKPYISDNKVWKCSREYYQDDPNPNPDKISYNVLFVLKDLPRPPIPSMAQRVARRGNDVPLVADIHHGIGNRILATHQKNTMVLVLRLDGRVERTQVPRSSPSWEW